MSLVPSLPHDPSPSCHSSQLWADYQRGLLTFPELQRLEAEAQPRCFVCGERTSGWISLGFVCGVCLTRLGSVLSDLQARLNTGRI